MSSAAAEAITGVEPTVGIRLVLGVARLGEADLAGWWSSQGMNPAVQFALAGFRRTGSIVGAELALLSAVRRHHQVLPRANAVYLFSPHLPFERWARVYLAELKSDGGSELLDELRTWETAQQAIDRLSAWISELEAGERREVVSPDELATSQVRDDLLVQLASGYRAQVGDLSVPYVDLAR